MYACGYVCVCVENDFSCVLDFGFGLCDMHSVHFKAWCTDAVNRHS